MSNWNQYRGLWQQKRNELHLDSDAQTDWSEMHNILDQQMPVAHTDATKSNPGAQGSVFTKFGSLSIISGVIIAGLVAYLLLHTNPASKVSKHKKSDHTEITKNTIAADSNATPAVSDDAGVKADSLDNNSSNPDISAAKTNNATGNGTSSNSKSDNTIATANGATGGNSAVSKLPVIKNNTADDKLVINNKPSALKHHTNDGSNDKTLIASNLSAPNHSIGRSNVSRQHNAHGLAFQKTNSRHRDSRQESGMPDNAADKSRSNDYNSANTSGFESVASLHLRWEDIVSGNLYPAQLPYPSVSITKLSSAKNSSNKKSSPKKPKAYGNNADIDWGILIGANTNGGFTTKAFNHNLYGALGADPYLGLFATGNINEHWSAGLQIKGLVPHMVKGAYAHKNESKTDTGQIFQFNDLRKVYTVDIPVQVIYHITPNFNLKGGPYISVPIKQTGGTSGYEKGPQRDNSGYYTAVDKSLNATDIGKKIQVGLSGGLGVSYHFLSLDASYNYPLQSQKVSSSLGGYSTRMNNLQITLGIQLNKKKK